MRCCSMPLPSVIAALLFTFRFTVLPLSFRFVLFCLAVFSFSFTLCTDSHLRMCMSVMLIMLCIIRRLVCIIVLGVVNG